MAQQAEEINLHTLKALQLSNTPLWAVCPWMRYTGLKQGPSLECLPPTLGIHSTLIHIVTKHSVRNRHLVAPYCEQHLNKAMPSSYCGTWGIFYLQVAFFVFLLQSGKNTIIEEKRLRLLVCFCYWNMKNRHHFIGWKKKFQIPLLFWREKRSLVALLSQILSNKKVWFK